MWPFSRRVKVTATTTQELVDALFTTVGKLQREHNLLREEHDGLKEQFAAFRARTYGRMTKRPGGRDLDQPVSLDDPSLSKAEVKARLVAAGRLKPSH